MCKVRGAKSESFQPPVPEDLCRAHLGKMASGATFARAEQLRRLLQWLGDRSLTGNAAPPTEKEIGETVLRRKEMSRLREKVMQYYEREGARERIRVQRAGGYLFRFVWWDLPDREAADESALPSLLVLPVRSHPDLNTRAVRLMEELLVRLGELGGVQLVSPTTALSYAGRVGDVREFAAECGADFVVEGSLELSDVRLRVTLWLVDGRSGRTERPGRFAAADLDELVESAAMWLRGQYSSPRL